MVTKSNNFINLLIFISTSIIIINFFFFVIEKSPVQYSDWLINYQGGFIRRGLPGEIFFRFYDLFKIRLDLIVFIFVSLLYLFFAVYFVQLLKKIKFNFLNLLIIFSPLSFLYPVMEQKVSGRKDIIFLFSVIILTTFLEKLKFENQKYLIFFFILISSFSHTGFFVFLPIFVTIYIIINNKISFTKLLFELLYILFFSIIVFILIFFNTSIDVDSVKKICTSIKDFLPNCGVTDYISTLSWSLKYEINLVKTIWTKEGYISFYSLAFLLANAPLIFAFYNSKFTQKRYSKFNPILIFLFINIISLPIYFIGADFGRYMYIAYISLVIIYFKSLSINFLNIKKKSFIKKKNLIILIVFLYGFTWTIPHCCNNNFKFIYKKPLLNVINEN